MLIRPIVPADLEALLALAATAGVGVTTLQPNPERLSARIQTSNLSLHGQLDLADASYLFVLEDDDSQQIVGICGVEAALGMHDTWYNYRVGLSVHASREMQIYKQLPTLFLTSDLTGSSELCSLFLKPTYRRDGNGALLSKSRFLFMAEFPDRFSERVIAEMRGVSDETGRSPFWESLGRHFFTMDFAKADFLSYVGSKSFIAELMPKHPIYTCFLSDEARAALGHVHPATEPARALLESEGFRYQGYVDIFDAGPSLECSLADIRAIKDSAVFPVLPVATEPVDGSVWLVSNRSLTDFRVTLAVSLPQDGILPLTSEVLTRLNLTHDATVRAVPLSAKV
ncbi:arginine N-succinyltransferase [Deefgea sp. CFH1-16]|uniref:arginine N-succinyltransferase n=1 Tax=Deefgea sp. CFH1-16 TaxID=2675457 RepID=UPI0015F4D285|nr:arginine N-succinyltransferase [Deefgea sp. CFH1-16]MBM5573121.1 arginine N-succinyltransferase [Deefgea sp. CFH1-16]